MKIHIAGLHLLSDDALAKIKATAAAEGHELVDFGQSEAAKLWAEFKAAEPDVVAAFQKGIADLKDSSLSGGDKAVKVAGDFLAAANETVQAIPGIKDLLVHGVTEVFADTESEIVKLGGEAIAALAKIV